MRGCLAVIGAITVAVVLLCGLVCYSAIQGTGRAYQAQRRAYEARTPTPEPATREAATKPSAPDAYRWDEAVRVGDAEVSLLRPEIGVVRTRAGRTSADRHLKIMLTVANRSTTRKLTYRTWRGAAFSLDDDYAILQDDIGNSYRRIRSGESTGASSDVESIYPNGEAGDMLVFEVPVDAARELRLTLPASNIDGRGEIVFVIRLPMNNPRPARG